MSLILTQVNSRTSVRKSGTHYPRVTGRPRLKFKKKISKTGKANFRVIRKHVKTTKRPRVNAKSQTWERESLTCEIWDFHGGDEDGVAVLGFGAAYTRWQVPMFLKNIIGRVYTEPKPWKRTATNAKMARNWNRARLSKSVCTEYFKTCHRPLSIPNSSAGLRWS
jgi:hypothetical protein